MSRKHQACMTHESTSCYNCCYSDEDDFSILPNTKDFDPHTALQDLRSIHGLSSAAFVKCDFTFDDIVRWTSDDQQQLAQIQGEYVGCCNCFRRRRQFQRVPLIEHRGDDILTAANRTPVLSIFPDYKCSRSVIAVVYLLVIVVYALFLILMNTEGLPPSIFRIKAIQTDMAFFTHLSGTSSKSSSSFDEIPRVDWSSFDYNSQRFAVFFALASIPIPFVFTTLVLCCKGMMSQMTKIILGGICEHVRRSVHMSSRQAIDIGFHDFLRRIDFFFHTSPTLRDSGKRQLHQQLHRSLDALNDYDLRYDKTWVGPRYASRYAIRPVLNEALSVYRGCFSCSFYFIPIIISFCLNFALSYFIAYRAIYYGWKPPPIDINILYQRFDLVLQNEGFQYILIGIFFNLLSWFWILVITAEDFAIFILHNSGLFERAREAAVDHANFLVSTNQQFEETMVLFIVPLNINILVIVSHECSSFVEIGRVWDANVVHGVLPFVESFKSPDLQWGDIHHQLQLTLQRLNFSSSVGSSQRLNNVTIPQRLLPTNASGNEKLNKPSNEKPALRNMSLQSSLTGLQWDPLATSANNLELQSDGTLKNKESDSDSNNRSSLLISPSVIELQKMIAKEAAESAVKLLGHPPP